MHDAAPLSHVMVKNAPILDLLRQNDRDAYVAALFVPEAKRAAVASIWAFNAEIERIAHLVSEPLPGEIRLQWWRDVCNGARSEEGRQHPVAAALLDTIAKYELPATAFDNLCDARIFDLYNDIIPTKADFEGYLGNTRSLLFQMCAQILGGGPNSAEASGHAGMAFGIAQLLRSLAYHRAKGQAFIPQDILRATELSVPQFLAIEEPSSADAIVEFMVLLGREHLELANKTIAKLPKEQRAAFILLGVCEPLLKRAQKRGGSIALEPFNISPFTAQWYLTRYAMGL